MNRYDIIMDKEPPEVFPAPPEPAHYPIESAREEEGLSVSLHHIGDLRTESTMVFEAMMVQMMKRANERGALGWKFERLGLEVNASLDTLSARCIYSKKPNTTLCPQTSLGSGEQRAGICPTLSDQLHDLWRLSPAPPASVPDRDDT